MLTKKLYLFILALFVSLPVLYSQAPEGINYQAVARDETGNVLSNQVISVRFSIRKNSPVDTIVYQETHSATTNGFGLFTLAIGEGSPVLGTLASVEWATHSCFLQVEIDDGSGYVSLGSTQFLSVPYALYAKEVGNGGGAGDDWGMQVVQTDTTLAGDGTTTNVLGLAQQGATSGEVLMWNGNNWAPAAVSGGGGFWTKVGSDIHYSSGSVGVNTSTPLTGLHVGDSTDVLFGKAMSGGPDNRFMWISNKGALRAGWVFSSNWDLDSIGLYSVAMGNNTVATGQYATALGRSTEATGRNATAIGSFTTASEDNAIAMGSQSTASGIYSMAMGRNTTASGSHSLATGRNSEASGNYSTAMGYGTVASGNNAHATGQNTMASGISTTAMGHASTANGLYAIAMGRNTLASGKSATAMGDFTTSSGDFSTAMGLYSIASGKNAMAMGDSAIASGNNAVAFGYHATATGSGSFAIGGEAVASGPFGSIAVGSNALASGVNSTALGASSKALGDYSRALGTYAEAIGWNSVAIGPSTSSYSHGEVAVGTRNTSYTPNLPNSWHPDDRLFVVGNGQINAHSNALTVFKDGRMVLGNSSPTELLRVGESIGDGLQLGSSETIRDNGSNRLETNADVVPETDGVGTLGASGNRWASFWATNGTINTSDRNDKTNIRVSHYGLETVLQMKPVRFQWSDKPEAGEKIGFLAQDLLKIVPEVVVTKEYVITDEETHTGDWQEAENLGVYYSDLIPVLTKAIQEQQAIIEEQQKQMGAMQQRVSNLESQ